MTDTDLRATALVSKAWPYEEARKLLKRVHPDKPVMSYEAFFRERQEARYGGKGGPKCC